MITRNELQKTTSNWPSFSHKKDNNTLVPAVDVYEDNTGITIYADMPGVAKDKLGLQVDNNVLTIQGEMELNLPDDNKIILSEISSKQYLRRFTLSKELDANAIKAEMKDGILKLIIPRSEMYMPRKIEVEYN